MFPLILYSTQNLSASTGSAAASSSLPLIYAADEYSFEIRVKFPKYTDSSFTPTQVDGAVLTIGDIGESNSYLSMWYEKNSVSSATGNIYLTSSNGRLEITSAPIFDGKFYNLSFVKNRVSSSITLSVMSHEIGELKYSTSSVAYSGSTGYPINTTYSRIEIGSSEIIPSSGEFWAQEFRWWNSALSTNELLAHSLHFESFGKEITHSNNSLMTHWRLDEGTSSDASGSFYVTDSTTNNLFGTGSNFSALSNNSNKFLQDYSYVPSVDYGWNQKKVRIYSGSAISLQDRYEDEKFLSLEFNLYDALNEDISHMMSSYDELNNMLGHPMNRYRGEYDGLTQMRETYFKRLQGQLSFKAFVDMLDFFDTTFVSMIEKLIPARSAFNGDELVIESHMLERPKFQYQLKPIREGFIEVSGTITVVDRDIDGIFG